MTAKSAKPWKMILPLVAMLVLAAIWTAYWFIALSMAQGEVAKARTRFAQDGLKLTCADERWAGFPFRFEYSCSEPKLLGPRGLSVQATGLSAIAMTYRPWHVILFQAGPTEASLPNLPPLRISHAPLEASIVATSAQSGQVIIEARDVDVEGHGKAGRILLSARSAAPETIDFAADLSALAVTLPEGRHVTLESAETTGTLRGREHLDINKIQVRNNTIEINGTGRFDRDPQNKPKGQFTLETSDAVALMAYLTKTFDLTSQEAAAFTALLTMTGGKLVLVANDGQLFAGPLKLADLPTLP